MYTCWPPARHSTSTGRCRRKIFRSALSSSSTCCRPWWCRKGLGAQTSEVGSQYVCLYIYMYIHVLRIIYIHIEKYYVHTYICHVYADIYTHLVCVYIHIYYVYIYVYMHTYIHTYKHTNIYMYVQHSTCKALGLPSTSPPGLPATGGCQARQEHCGGDGGAQRRP